MKKQTNKLSFISFLCCIYSQAKPLFAKLRRFERVEEINSFNFTSSIYVFLFSSKLIL